MVEAWASRCVPILAHPMTGDFAQWCDESGIPTVEIELASRLDPALDRNVLGIEAVLQQLSSRAPDQSY